MKFAPYFVVLSLTFFMSAGCDDSLSIADLTARPDPVVHPEETLLGRLQLIGEVAPGLDFSTIKTWEEVKGKRLDHVNVASLSLEQKLKVLKKCKEVDSKILGNVAETDGEAAYPSPEREQLYKKTHQAQKNGLTDAVFVHLRHLKRTLARQVVCSVFDGKYGIKKISFDEKGLLPYTGKFIFYKETGVAEKLAAKLRTAIEEQRPEAFDAITAQERKIGAEGKLLEAILKTADDALTAGDQKENYFLGKSYEPTRDQVVIQKIMKECRSDFLLSTASFIYPVMNEFATKIVLKMPKEYKKPYSVRDMLEVTDAPILNTKNNELKLVEREKQPGDRSKALLAFSLWEKKNPAIGSFNKKLIHNDKCAELRRLINEVKDFDARLQNE